jgi:hypothetical protein
METTETLEPILFTNIIEANFRSNKVSHISKELNYVAAIIDCKLNSNLDRVIDKTVEMIKCN